ncbi:2,5-diketo-D-gluconate reductase B [Haladaptatus litoreus]|uniref:2,5-diketo-D-gluconate reductase B n=1 Tax=Haladaptatus litoreus TaxID=553468 RepID=A0A1N6VXJ1_9EURY|nr:aldo/keto reductase [Haladaptatus litoreus]SIQ82478.1 2,5-diketo-D-gluconate reductase B [Haladaptatus litoreus]
MPRKTIPKIGVGTYENTDPEVCKASVETALNLGYRHVDTAEMYENEAAVGEGIAATDCDRDDVFISTKIHSANLGYEDVLTHARESCDRLGVDVLDLLYVHWPIRAYDPEETLSAFDELYDRGLIRHVGLSNFTPALLETALEALDAPLLAHQVECHPLLQQKELRKFAREHGHRFVAYSPLAKGSVTEMPELVDIADKHGATPAQVSLAWLLSKECVVIPKSSSESHLRENFEARRISLDKTDIERIDGIDRTTRQVDFEAAPWS